MSQSIFAPITDTDPQPWNEIQRTGSGSASDPDRISPVSCSSGSGIPDELPTAPRQPKKKARSSFSRSQMKMLVQAFNKHQYLSKDDMHNLEQRTKLTHKQVKTWFQNRRMNVRRKQNHNRRESERNGSGGVRPAGGSVPSHVQPYQGHAHPLPQHMIGATVQKPAPQNRFAVGSGGVSSGYPMVCGVNGGPAVHPNGFGAHGASCSYPKISGFNGGPAVHPNGFGAHGASCSYPKISGFNGGPAVHPNGFGLHGASPGNPLVSGVPGGPAIFPSGSVGGPAVHPNGFGAHGASCSYPKISGVNGGPAVHPNGFGVHGASPGYPMVSGVPGGPALFPSCSGGGPAVQPNGFGLHGASPGYSMVSGVPAGPALFPSGSAGRPAVQPNGFGVHGASPGYPMVSGVPGWSTVYPTGFGVHAASPGYPMVSGFQGPPAFLPSGSGGPADNPTSSFGPNQAAVPKKPQASGWSMPPSTNHDEDDPTDFYSAGMDKAGHDFDFQMNDELPVIGQDDLDAILGDVSQ